MQVTRMVRSKSIQPRDRWILKLKNCHYTNIKGNASKQGQMHNSMELLQVQKTGIHAANLTYMLMFSPALQDSF